MGPYVTRKLRVVSYTPAGTPNGNPATFEQRTRAFTEAAVKRGAAFLIVQRTGGALRYYAMFPDGAGADAAERNLHEAVAARATLVDTLPDLSAGGYAALRQRLSGQALRSTQSGVDVTTTAAVIATTLTDGQWVGMSLRHIGLSERGRWSRWLSHRLGSESPTHHSMRPGAVVASLFAGADTPDAARVVVQAVAMSLPGFDQDTEGETPSNVAPIGVSLFAALAGFVGWFAPRFITESWTQTLAMVPAHVWALLLVVGLIGFVATVSGALPTVHNRLRRATRKGVLPPPPHRLLPPRSPRKASVKQDANGTVRQVDASDGDYPLHPYSFKVGAALPAAFISPHGGATSGELTTLSRSVPPAVQQRIGPLIGTGPNGEPVHLSAADGQSGVAIVGRPSSGKSVLTQHLMAFAMAERRHVSAGTVFVGGNNSIVDFEAKLDGAQRAMQWAQQMGEKAMLIELANPDSYAIDMFAVPGTVADRALHFVNAMVYAFDAGDIRAESMRTLKMVLTGGLAVTDEIASGVGVEPGRSPIFYAYVLMGQRGADIGQRLAAQIREQSDADSMAGLSGTDAQVAWRELIPMYGEEVKDSDRRQLWRAPGNKLDQLMVLDHWFSPSRRHVTWKQVLDSPAPIDSPDRRHKAVVILTGVDSAGHMMEDSTRKLFSSLLMFTLKYNVERYCSGWEEQGRAVTLFCDELTELAGSSPAIIDWMRNRGRSYGVRPVFATQYPNQLLPEVREAFMSFSSLISFAQGSQPAATAVAEDLGGDWTVDDVLYLSQYHAVARLHVNFQRQVPFVFVSRSWEGDPEGFLRDQGFVS